MTDSSVNHTPLILCVGIVIATPTRLVMVEFVQEQGKREIEAIDVLLLFSPLIFSPLAPPPRPLSFPLPIFSLLLIGPPCPRYSKVRLKQHHLKSVKYPKRITSCSLDAGIFVWPYLSLVPEYMSVGLLPHWTLMYNSLMSN